MVLKYSRASLNVFHLIIIFHSLIYMVFFNREMPEKRQSYIRIRDRVLLNLLKYDVIVQENHISENAELCELILRTLVIPDRDYEHIERLLVLL